MKVVLLISAGPDRFSGVPSLDSHADTVSNESSDSITAGPNSTVHLRVTSDPLRIILPLLLVIVTDRGAGTIREKGMNYQ